MSRELLQQALDALIFAENFTKGVIDNSKEITAIREELRYKGANEALAKPEQEPKLTDAGADTNIEPFTLHPKGSGMVALNQVGMRVDLNYAPPRKPWVGLTDDEIQFMAHNDDKGDWNDLRFRSCWHNGYVDGVNAANDKLKEKNT